jgi:predicted MFS family arabinose efflux permease
MRTTSEPAAPAVVRDLRRILAVQALRAFLYGFSSVILGTTLAGAGLSDVQVGFVFTAMLAGTALISIVVGIIGDRVGRRSTYAFLLGVMGLAGTVYAFTTSLPVLIVVALTGTLSTDANESGPITSLEQAMLGSAPPAARSRVFGRYNAIAYLAGALGALSAGGPAAFRSVIPSLPPDQRWLLMYGPIAAACVVVAMQLTSDVEPAKGGAVAERGRGRHGKRSNGPARPPLGKGSKRTVKKLAALFGLDAFAGGFVVTTFVVFWFTRKFGASAETMSLVVFAGGLIQAGSSIASGWLGAKIGLLNTMVFTHLPSNILLVLVPLMPTLGLAIAVLLLRFTLSQMDVPARQAYVVTMVDPSERTAAAAFTNTARYVVRPFGAAGAGVLLQAVGFGAPFFVAGSLKVLYDVLLYRTFRSVPLPEDQRSGT